MTSPPTATRDACTRRNPPVRWTCDQRSPSSSPAAHPRRQGEPEQDACRVVAEPARKHADSSGVHVRAGRDTDDGTRMPLAGLAAISPIRTA